MIQEYLFTSDQYKADLENLSISPKVTKEITTIENSKCWTLLISVPGVSMEAAKILDPLNRKVCENYRPTVLANECSAYFNKALYPIVNEFERKLRKLLYLASSLHGDENSQKVIVGLEEQELGNIFETLFSDAAFVKKAKETINKTLSWQFTRAELLDAINKLDENRFNKSVDANEKLESGKRADKNAAIIFRKLDNFRSRRPIDIIAKTNPILIIDEPQSVEGPAAKKNLKLFSPLLTLRYSATHKADSIYNMVYRLDAMEAYNKRLVKKIAVKGITESGSTATEGFVYLESINLSKSDPTATIQFDCKGASGIRKKTATVGIGYNLYDNSGNLDEYKVGFVVKSIDGRDNSVEFLNGVKIFAGDVIGKVSEDQLRRIQISLIIIRNVTTNCPGLSSS